MNDLPRANVPKPTTADPIFSRLEQVGSRRERLLEVFPGPNPLEICIEKFVTPVRGIINGREMVLMGNNNYLGLTHDPACIDASLAAISRYGAGATASRVASGTLSEHLEVESQIAALLQKQSALLFTTGFMANLGLLGGLLAAGDMLFIDEDCHASIYDAARLSAARYAKFRHNDPEDLSAKIAKSDSPHNVIVTESVFSAMGDLVPLQEIVDVKKAHGAALIVDEAHSFGLYGDEGGGLCVHEGLAADVDVIVGTLSKAAGSIGGFAASNYSGFYNLRYLARSFMFTAAPPAASVGMARASLERIRDGQALRSKFWANIAYLREAIAGSAFNVNSTGSPVTTIQLDSMVEGYNLWRHLYDNGVYVNALLPPATPQSTFAIRISISAAHTKEDMDKAIAALLSFR